MAGSQGSEAAASAGDVWTVARILDATTQHLKKSGSDTPRLDAEILLAQVRGCKRIQLYVDYADPLSDDQRTRMRELVKRRANHEPVAYLVGRREFYSLNFKVTPDVLIPRPETETLVLDLVTTAKPLESPTILDLGTGSGCIAIAAAHQLPNAQVMAIDQSPHALAVARENAVQHKVADRVRFLEGDLFAPLEPGTQFDVIASNPPYVADDEMATLPPDVRDHEPASALKAGPKGLDVLQRIIDAAPDWLKPTGVLLLEFSPEQAADLTALLENRGFTSVKLLKDAAGRQRIARASAFENA